MRRGYQRNFYDLSKLVRDRASRQRKAAKIRLALSEYVNRDLAAAKCADVGCSSGMIASELAPLFSMVLGLEYDEVALRATDAEARAGVSFVRSDAMNLPVREGSVDVALCTQVYEHVPDDERLFQELYRILPPGGVVYFSGPNWLFPIEPHYRVPFLHWLPRRWADAVVRRLGRGPRYYERLRSLWGLRRLAGRFVVTDISVHMLQAFHLPHTRGPARLLRSIPTWVWRLLLPVFPTYDWILRKPLIQEVN